MGRLNKPSHDTNSEATQQSACRNLLGRGLQEFLKQPCLARVRSCLHIQM